MAAKDKDTLKSDIDTAYPDNTSGQITPEVQRQQLKDDVDSSLNCADTETQSIDSPVVFNESIAVPPSSLVLGNVAKISSGGRALDYTDAYGDNNIYVGARIRPDGVGPEETFVSDAAPIVFNVCPDGGTALSDPQTFQFDPALGNNLSVGFEVIPATSGTLLIESFEGVGDSGGRLVKNKYEILPGDVGNTVMLVTTNPQLGNIGDQQFVRFSGIQLEGAVQSGGLFTGQLKPFLQSEIYIGDIKPVIVDGDDVSKLTNDAGYNGLGYVLATWGANLQTIGRHPAINSPSNTAEITSLGIMASMPVTAAGTIDTITYYNSTGDNTTELQIIKNGVVMYTFTCTGPYGVETGINVPIGFAGSVPDNIAIRYSAGTAPSEGLYTAYIN